MWESLINLIKAFPKSCGKSPIFHGIVISISLIVYLMYLKSTFIIFHNTFVTTLYYKKCFNVNFLFLNPQYNPEKKPAQIFQAVFILNPFFKATSELLNTPVFR